MIQVHEYSLTQGKHRVKNSINASLPNVLKYLGASIIGNTVCGILISLKFRQDLLPILDGRLYFQWRKYLKTDIEFLMHSIP